jgi:cytoskeletal protein RodZ
MDSDGLTLGEFLRSGRERAGVTLAQISAETKIPVRHLQALEAENLGVLPSGLYLRAEVRAYARLVGRDQNTALAHLERLLQPPPVAATPEPSKVRLPIASPKNIAALAGVVTASVLLGLVSTGREPSVAEAPVAGVAVTPSTSDAPTPQDEVSTTGDIAAPAPLPEVATEPPVVKTTDDSEVADVTTKAGATQLLIVSDPPGARVTVDGVGWGETPVTVTNLPPGVKRIRVTKAGYTGQERVAQVTDERPTTVRISLQTTPD